jgi:hypothetical protein
VRPLFRWNLRTGTDARSETSAPSRSVKAGTDHPSSYPSTLMQKAVPKIFLGGWCLWVLYRLVQFLTSSIWHTNASYLAWGRAVSFVAIPALGGWLAWQLYERPNGKRATWLAVVCLLLLWKFFVADLLLGMPTFAERVHYWWSAVSASPIFLLMYIFSFCLLWYSLLFWPGYCLKRKKATVSPVPPIIPDGKAACTECGRFFAAEDMIKLHGHSVCAQCKPVLVQKLTERADLQR